MQDEKKKFNLPELEEKVLKFWEDNKIFEKSLEKTKKGKTFVFYEGPPTANGMPGVHHAESRAFKDVILRYKTMRGFHVPRKAGWDTHGLPVEIEVEKALGFKIKQDIERYGIAKFNEKARESVWRYKAEWERATKRLGFWLDLEHPYITYETTYIESLWWIIKEIWKKGLLYKDFKVVPWCPRCQTGLSSHELGLGYKKIKEESIYVKLKIKDRRNEYLLVWTTTPWTLPANVAVAIHPKLDYTKFKIGEEFIWSLHTPPSDKGQKVDVVEKASGKSLLGLKYEPLFRYKKEYLRGNPPEYITIPGEFISTEEGTGMVHIAPAFGDEDMNVARARWKDEYPLLHTVNPDGTMKKGVIGEGRFTKYADKIITEDLQRRGLLLKVEQHEHDYPFCWRCSAPLLYFARTAWWIKMSALRKQLLANNEKINWIPEHIKHGRFGEFLKEVRDWAFSRERYWGTPLPIWICEKCSEAEAIGSIKELVNKSGGLLPRDEKGEINLHRPYVDDLQWSCRKCRGAMKRVPEVADVWFDSGAMPFAQAHYPFAKQKNNQLPVTGYQFQFPSDYIVEAVDQTRGWFYTLLAVSTLLGRGAPYRNAISLGHVLDKNGQKMSKSKGNVVDPGAMIQKYGADALRWYFYTVNAPGEPKRFDEKDLFNSLRNFLGTLWNSFLLFDIYVDKIRNPKSEIRNPKNALDIWILVKLQRLIAEATKKLDSYDITGAARLVEEFTINDFSQWYLRRSRRRFQHPKDAREKKEAAGTTARIILALCKISAPFTPFLAETIYQEMRKKVNTKEQSVHLAVWPKLELRIKNQELRILGDMKKTREIVAAALKLRAEAGIKVRQPLASLQIRNPKSEIRNKSELLELIKDEMNVKEITFGDELKLDTKITPELKEEGMVREIIRNIQEMRKELGLVPKDEIRAHFSGTADVLGVIEHWEKVISGEAGVKKLTTGGKKVFKIEREIDFGGEILWIGISQS